MNGAAHRTYFAVLASGPSREGLASRVEFETRDLEYKDAWGNGLPLA
jgi:hypothetical protein